VAVGVVAMDARAPEADSSRGGAIARGSKISGNGGDCLGPGVLLSVDFHGVFARPRLCASATGFGCGRVCCVSAATC
jgi:hypothetical protein